MTFQDSPLAINEGLTNLDFISKIIEHLIWPLTLLIIFIVFRKHLSNIMQKLSGIDASATGISLKFDKQIDNAIENFLPTQDEDPLIAKTAIKIGEQKEPELPKTPFQQILSVRDELNHQIILKSQKNNISTISKSSIDLKNELLNSGAISLQEAKLFQTLIDLTNACDKTITQSQVNKVKLLSNTLKL
jgi:hypothetical protein